MGCAGACFGEPMLAVVIRGEGAVKLFKAKGPGLQLAKKIPVGKDPSEMCVDPTEKRIYVAETSKNEVAVIDVATQSVVATFKDPDMKKLDGCTVSPDSSKLYMIDAQGNALVVFATDSGKVLARIPVGKQPRRALFTRDGKSVLVSNAREDTISVIDAASAKVIRAVKTGKEPRDMVWTRDGKFLAVALINDDSIAYFKADTLELDQQVGTERSPQRLAVSLDGELMYSLSRYQNSISIAEIGKGGERRFQSTIPVGRYAMNMAMSADGRYIYTGNTSIDDTISIVDLRYQKVMNFISSGAGPGCMIFLK